MRKFERQKVRIFASQISAQGNDVYKGQNRPIGNKKAHKALFRIAYL